MFTECLANQFEHGGLAGTRTAGDHDSASFMELSAVGTSEHEQFRRYAAVIHLRVPGPGAGYNQQNPLRIESAAQANAIDARIVTAWARHPRRFLVDASTDFLTKASRAIEILRAELPACCRQHEVPLPGSSPRRRAL
jgi:hypothetical protein